MKRGKPLKRSNTEMKRTPLKRTRMKFKPKRNPMPEGRYEQIMARDRQCQAPVHGAPYPCFGPLEVHHLKNRGMGGSADPSIHDPENLMVLCGFHNGWVEDHPAHAKALGLKH